MGQPSKTYRPAHGLITEVRIYLERDAGKYTFYNDARSFVGVKGERAPFSEYRSLWPSYGGQHSMTPAQRSYYFWWRTNFEAGKCLKASKAYLLLYIYEKINFHNAIDPEIGRDNILRLWLSYRDQCPGLDARLCEWLCDYCLVHELPPPALPPALFNDLVGGCRLREFYVTAADGDDGMVDALLYFGSNYDYKKSKFYTPETAALFEKTLRGAVRLAFADYETKNAKNKTRNGTCSKISRDAFSGAVCSYHLKKRIEIDYYSFSHTHELRYLVTDVLKYAENAVRASLGIKPRLTVYAVNAALREKLDAYLAAAVPPRVTRRTPAKEQRPDYEKRYDLPPAELSPAKAAAIEAASWQITERLVTAFDDGSAKSTETGRKNTETVEKPTPATEAIPVAPDPAEKTPISDTLPPLESGTSGLAAALGDLLPFVRLCAAGDGAGQRAFALSLGSMPDAVADRVNTIATDVFGDVILEETDGVYAVIPDYLNDLKKEGVL